MSSIQHGRLYVSFGALSAPLAEQLDKYSLTIPGPRLALFQSQADAIVRLCVGGILSDGETHRARQRLMKRISAEARERPPSTSAAVQEQK